MGMRRSGGHKAPPRYTARGRRLRPTAARCCATAPQDPALGHAALSACLSSASAAASAVYALATGAAPAAAPSPSSPAAAAPVGTGDVGAEGAGQKKPRSRRRRERGAEQRAAADVTPSARQATLKPPPGLERSPMATPPPSGPPPGLRYSPESASPVAGESASACGRWSGGGGGDSSAASAAVEAGKKRTPRKRPPKSARLPAAGESGYRTWGVGLRECVHVARCIWTGQRRGWCGPTSDVAWDNVAGSGGLLTAASLQGRAG